MIYRPQIDGLRAIAVLAVVLYHFGTPGVGGGFIGVDIFFVISGFLIGGILWDEWTQTRSIDLPLFFARRVRRLAPAFFAVTLTTLAVAYFIVLPFEFRELGKSVIASTVWLSNVQFFREAGYFDIGAESKILLHTWSLAVEEQFYVLLPLALLALRQQSKKTVILILGVTWLLSLTACILTTPRVPSAAFFLFPFRAWELLTGVLLAIWIRETGQATAHGPLPSWLGLLLLVSGIAVIQPGPQFPGVWALMPVIGTALVLMNHGDRNPVNTVLASRVPVFIGLISYSLYLWHWPVFTLSNHWRGAYSGGLEASAWLALAFGLAIGAWALVEKPLRTSASTRSLMVGVAAVASLTMGLGLWAYLSAGAPERFAAKARVHIEASNGFFHDWSRCSVATEGALQGIEICTVGPPGTPRVLFWGDSHLRAIMAGVQAAAQESGTPGLVIWHAGCPPLFGVRKRESAATPNQDLKCHGDTETLRKAMADMRDIDRIVLVGRWSYYASGSGVGDDQHNRIELSTAPGSGIDGTSQARIYASAWQKTVADLQTHFDEIHVLRQVPEIPRYAARDLSRQIVHRRIDEGSIHRVLTVSGEELSARVRESEVPLFELARAGSIQLIDTWPTVCKPDCTVVHDGQSHYFDNNHLSNAGAMAMRHLLLPALTGQRP